MVIFRSSVGVPSLDRRPAGERSAFITHYALVRETLGVFV
jgi:hypothetical protein